MHIYFSDIPRHNLQTRHLITLIANLYRVGYLADESKVWVRTDTFEPQLWTLADKSSLTHYHASVKAGCVRITNNRIRWAPTVDGSQSNPVIDIDLSRVSQDALTHFTLVIEHCEGDDPNAGVTVIDNSARQDYVDGMYSSDTGIRVIDAARYNPRTLSWKDPDTGESNFFPSEQGISSYQSITDYDSANAWVFGTKFAAGGNKTRERYLSDNLDAFCIDFSHDEMHGLKSITAGNIDELAIGISGIIKDNVNPPQ